MSLQAKVQETVDLLATLGLKVNIAKCSTLDVEEGIGAGIFLRGHPVPLRTEKAVLYLGVPLSFDFRPMTVFARALGRCCNTYFAMRNLFNSKSLPARQKFFLFDLYVTSRWLWCSGLVWPTKQALRSINSQQTTLLLGLLGFRADFFGEFVHNVVAKSRAVKHVLHCFGLESWSLKWLKQVWRYWGHVVRNTVATRLRFLVWEYGTQGLLAGRAYPGWVSRIALRKMQIAYAELRSNEHPALWDTAAQDRVLWQSLLDKWKRHWLGDAAPSCDFLGRQLVVIADQDAALRPFRHRPEDPYEASVCRIRKACDLPSGPFLWAPLGDACVSVAIVSRGPVMRCRLIVQEAFRGRRCRDVS